MITLYLLTIALFLIAFVVKYVRFLRNYYTQKTLTRLRDLRHDASIYLTDGTRVNITDDGQREVRELLHIVNHSIVNFDKVVREHFMTFRGMKKMIIAISDSNANMKKIEVGKDEMLVDFKRSFAKALLAAFNGVPFGRVRIVFAFSKTVLKFLVSLGVAKLQKYVYIISSLETSYQEDLIGSGKQKKRQNLQPELC